MLCEDQAAGFLSETIKIGREYQEIAVRSVQNLIPQTVSEFGKVGQLL